MDSILKPPGFNGTICHIVIYDTSLLCDLFTEAAKIQELKQGFLTDTNESEPVQESCGYNQKRFIERLDQAISTVVQTLMKIQNHQ